MFISVLITGNIGPEVTERRHKRFEKRTFYWMLTLIPGSVAPYMRKRITTCLAATYQVIAGGNAGETGPNLCLPLNPRQRPFI